MYRLGTYIKDGKHFSRGKGASAPHHCVVHASYDTKGRRFTRVFNPVRSISSTLVEECASIHFMAKTQTKDSKQKHASSYRCLSDSLLNSFQALDNGRVAAVEETIFPPIFNNAMIISRWVMVMAVHRRLIYGDLPIPCDTSIGERKSVTINGRWRKDRWRFQEREKA